MESNENEDNFQNISFDLKELKLGEKDVQSLEKQNSRIVAEFKGNSLFILFILLYYIRYIFSANKLEADARKNWDLFYKRNETKFFKDRHWTTREFQELIGDSSSQDQGIVKS